MKNTKADHMERGGTHLRRYNKVSACIYPDKYGCKGCPHNEVPELFDGGCRLQKSVQDLEADDRG